MIATAFERLPAPDPRRLAALEQQLLERRRPRGRTKFAWWWLVGALLAGVASALWWAVDYDSGKGQEAPVPAVTPPLAPSVPDQPAARGQPEGADSMPAGEQAQKRRPIIFQRERSQ